MLDIAYQNPITGGKAVFQARAILMLEIHDAEIGERTIRTEPYSTAKKYTALDKGFTLHPNPTKDNCLIKLKGYSSKVLIQIKNSLGQVVLQKEISGSTNSYLINSLSFEQGFYFVVINDGETNKVQKLVILR